jgi:SAM-dependent methyltransferase
LTRRLRDNGVVDNRTDEIAGIFNRASSTYGGAGLDFFGHFGVRVIRLAQVRSGCSLLDVGCGTGAALLPAAAAVAHTRPVVGMDISSGMLVEARGRLAAGGLSATVTAADAVHLPFPDAIFDVVVSSFAFGYFSAPGRAAAEIRRVLTPGGAVAICVSDGWWFQGDPQWRWHEDLLIRLEAPLGSGPFRHPDALAGVLADGGLKVESVEAESYPLLWADVDEWWRSHWSHGYRKVLEALSGPRLEEYRRRCFERLATGPISGRLEVLLATAG